MGERYQSHIMFEVKERFLQKDEKDTKEIKISVHMQWCWGDHIVRNMHRVLNTLDKSLLEYVDAESIKSYVEAIFTLNKTYCGKFYPFSVHIDDEYETFNGDSNHGWNVIKVNVDKKGKTKVASRFYDTAGNDVSNEELIAESIEEIKARPKSKENLKNIEQVKKMCTDKLFNNTTEDLQKLFNKGIE